VRRKSAKLQNRKKPCAPSSHSHAPFVHPDAAFALNATRTHTFT
jgi:hypothetical protein